MGMAQSSWSSSRPSDSEQLEEPSKPVMALDKAKEIVASSPVVVFRSLSHLFLFLFTRVYDVAARMINLC